MTSHQTANMVWRMENMDERTRRMADERVGLFAHMLRRAAGRGGVRGGRSPSAGSRSV